MRPNSFLALSYELSAVCPASHHSSYNLTASETRTDEGTDYQRTCNEYTEINMQAPREPDPRSVWPIVHSKTVSGRNSEEIASSDYPPVNVTAIGGLLYERNTLAPNPKPGSSGKRP